jgi:ATP-dependent Clp protease ATP-binding subunit ClpA
MGKQYHSNELAEKIFSLFWYSILLYFASIFIFRFGSTEWIGDYPLSGFAITILITHIAQSLLESDGWKMKVRMGLPGIVFLGIWHTGDFVRGIVQAFQDSLGSMQFFILLFSIIISLILTLEGTTSKGTHPSTRKKLNRTGYRKAPHSSQSAFEKIVGQDHVIKALKEIARLAKSNIRVGKDQAPYAVVLFLGPTGVGKTEAARALAEAVYGSPDALIRFDMGQFADAHQANRFYGPPPGYVGYEQGGQLTRAVMRRPRSVVLLDEVEKADPKIWDAFLTVFDEGYIVDGSSNQRVDMTQTIIVMTSNLLSDDPKAQNLNPLQIKETILETGAFKTELIGRINEIFVFSPLGKETIRKILQQRVDSTLWGLAEQGVKITHDQIDIEQMILELEAAKFGVRQIDDVLRKKVRTILTERSQPTQVD